MSIKYILALALLASIGLGSATMYYLIYNTPVEFGSTGEIGDVVDVTPLNSSAADGNWTLLRIWDIAPGQVLNCPKTASKLTYQQWNDTEVGAGGYDGALDLYQIDEVQDMR